MEGQGVAASSSAAAGRQGEPGSGAIAAAEFGHPAGTFVTSGITDGGEGRGHNRDDSYVMVASGHPEASSHDDGMPQSPDSSPPPRPPGKEQPSREPGGKPSQGSQTEFSSQQIKSDKADNIGDPDRNNSVIAKVPSVRMIRFNSDLTRDTRAIAEECPVALVYDGTTAAVLMATPADLADLAVGFSLTEEIIREAGEIEGLDMRTRVNRYRIAHMAATGQRPGAEGATPTPRRTHRLRPLRHREFAGSQSSLFASRTRNSPVARADRLSRRDVGCVAMAQS